MKTTDSPTYSIVIPTRNREAYLPYAIESVLATRRADVEVVVSNNYSSDGTADVLAGLLDPRVRVVMPPTELPMAAHYEFALAQARGEWVTLLGDDDAVMPYIFERLDSLAAQYPDAAIVSSARAYYFWPGCEDLYGDRVMEYDPGTGTAALRSTRGDLLLALAGLRSCFDMPQIYTTGIVRRDVVERVRQASGGRFYHSIIPDMYSAVALSLQEDRYLRVQEPLFWTGTSNKSMGRSDRIYKDSAMAKPGGGGRPAVVGPAGLHADIPQELHILGFESLYLYEAVLQCPLAKGRPWTGRFVAALTFASLWSKAVSVAASREVALSQLRRDILAAAGRHGVKAGRVRAGAAFLRAVGAIRGALRLPSRVWRRLRRFFVETRLVSVRREQLPTILDASNAVDAWNGSRPGGA